MVSLIGFFEMLLVSLLHCQKNEANTTVKINSDSERRGCIVFIKWFLEDWQDLKLPFQYHLYTRNSKLSVKVKLSKS